MLTFSVYTFPHFKGALSPLSTNKGRDVENQRKFQKQTCHKWEEGRPRTWKAILSPVRKLS